MIASSSEYLPLEKCPALVLNADYRPLSYYPLSLWSWQDAVRDVFLDRVNIVSTYDREIRSPSFSMKLPSVHTPGASCARTRTSEMSSYGA